MENFIFCVDNWAYSIVELNLWNIMLEKDNLDISCLFSYLFFLEKDNLDICCLFSYLFFLKKDNLGIYCLFSYLFFSFCVLTYYC